MKCRYRVRWFSSKGAGLVLLWTTLNSIVINSFHYFINSNVHLDTYKPLEWLLTIPVFLVFLSAPLSGWLADAKFGNYKVFRVGAVLLFIATVINCLVLILEEVVWENNNVLKWIHLFAGSSLWVTGSCAFFATALHLGLDQMPDASSSSISSYIAWFVCSFFVGGFVGQGFDVLGKHCLDKATYSSYTLLWALLLVVCMSIVLASNFLFTPKWLIIEPKSPQSLKTIYQVLKFAVKHKSPLNRSAFTYWEDDIPSRIDLGKSKYGGPFTTEQVEDVKTISRLLAISLPFFILLFTLSLYSEWEVFSTIRYLGLNFCTSNIVHLLFLSTVGWGLVGFLAYEFLIYPLVRNRLPSILKRIGIVSLLVTLTSFICFALKLAQFLSLSGTTIDWIVHVLHQASSGISFQYLLTLIFEFMCAQSPYNMRGLLLSLVVPLVIAIAGVNVIIEYSLANICSHTWCSLVSFSVRTVVCLIGFLLFCVVARWYKRRVRDEDYSPQRVVEEVYDRYLTAAAAQSRTYGAIN